MKHLIYQSCLESLSTTIYLNFMSFSRLFHVYGNLGVSFRDASFLPVPIPLNVCNQSDVPRCTDCSQIQESVVIQPTLCVKYIQNVTDFMKWCTIIGFHTACRGAGVLLHFMPIRDSLTDSVPSITQAMAWELQWFQKSASVNSH